VDHSGQLKKNYPISYYTAVIIALAYVLIRVTLPPHNILSYDVFGYYLYLPTFFIQQDPGLHSIAWIEQINEIYNNTPSLFQIAATEQGNWIIRFNCGISIMYSPFFLIGHLVAHLTPYPQDGFSLPYQWAFIIGGIFYALIGIWAMRKVLLMYFDDRITAITMAVLFLGSSVFFFGTMGNKEPHIFLFTMITLLILLTARWHASPSWKLAAGIGLLAGIIAASRTTGILASSIPVLWGIFGYKSLKVKIRLMLSHYGHVLLVLSAFILALSPQLIYWKVYSGQFIFNAYDDPQSGFDFLHPRLHYVLFGFRKGFFIYSPVMVLAVIGLFAFARQQRNSFLPVLVYVLVMTYVISSFSTLTSFGWRAFVEMHAVLALPLGFLIHYLFTRKRIAVYAFSAFFLCVIALNVFKSYQILFGVIDGSRMTKEYYFSTFFKTRVTEKDKELLLVERQDTRTEIFKDRERYQGRKLVKFDFETSATGSSTHCDTTIVREGKYSLKLDSTLVWSPAFRIPYKEITGKDHAWIHVSVDVFLTDETGSGNTFLATLFKYKKRSYKYRGLSFNDLGIEAPVNQWTTLSYDYMTPEVRTTDDLLEVHVWYTGKKSVYVDNLEVEVFERKD
jgi:hypothetical protein